MDTRSLGDLLRRAESLFRRVGAERHADALGEVGAAIASVPNQSVDEFARRAAAKLSEPDVIELPPEEIATRLRNLRRDREGFNQLFAKLSHKSFSKEKTIAVALAYCGTSAGLATKPKALRAIKSFFDERLQLSITTDLA